MKKINQFIVTMMLLSSGIVSTVSAQCPRLNGFSMSWNFCDQNGNNLSESEDICVGDKVYMINKSRYGVTSQGLNGAFSIGNKLVDGEYTFRNPSNNDQIFLKVLAEDWPYNGVIERTATAAYASATTGTNPNNNFRVQYFATNSCGATPAPGHSDHTKKTLWYHAHVGPTVTVSASSTTICKGESAVLTASGGSSLVWSNGTRGNTAFVTPSTTTTYSVTGENGFGCSSTEEITVNVVDASLNINSMTSCGTQNLCFVNNNNSSMVWFLNEGISTTTIATGPCVSLSQTGNYIVVNTITLPDGNTCSSVEHFSFTNTGGQLDPSFDHTTSIQGNYYTVTANAYQNPFPTGVTGVGYWWKVENLTTGCSVTNYNKWWNNVYPSIANGFTNNFPEFNGANCQLSTSLSSHGRFEFDQLYKITRGVWSDCDKWVTSYNMINLNRTGKGRTLSKKGSEVTYLSDSEVAQLKEEFIASGSWDENGPITISSEISVGDISKSTKAKVFLEVYPNPSNGNFNLELKDVAGSLIEIIDLTGKKVLVKRVLNDKMTINISDQPNGVYLIKLINGNSVEVKRIIKQ